MDNYTHNTAQKSSEKNFSEFIHRAPVGILIFEADGIISFVNENFSNFGILYSFDTASLEGSNIFERDIFPGKNLSTELEDLSEGIPFEKEINKVQTLNRGSINLIVKGNPLFEDDEFSGGIIIVEDIKISSDVDKEHPLKPDYIGSFFNRSKDLLFIADKGGLIKYFFGNNIEKLNLPNPADKEIHISRIIPVSFLEEFNDKMAAAAKSRRGQNIPVEFTLGVEKAIYECRIEPILNKRGQVQYFYFFLNDITDKIVLSKKYENEINELKQYQALTEAVTDAVFALSMEGNIVFWNKACEVLFGFSKSEVYGKYFGKILGLFEQDYFDRIKEELEKHNDWKSEINVFKKDGNKEIIEAKFTLTGEPDQNIVVLCTNITLRANVEKQLRTSEEKFRNIVTQAAELICNIDPDGSITYANPMFLAKFKFSEEEILSKNIKQLIDPDYLKKSGFDIHRLAEDASATIEFPVINKSGSKLFLLAKFSPIYYDNNAIRYYHGFFIDITERKKAEKDLKIYQSIFDASQDGIAIESEGKILLANTAFLEIFGYEKTESIVGREVLDLVANNDVLKIAEYIELISKQKDVPGRFEFMGKRKDGSNFHSEVSVSSFKSEEKIYAVMVTRDVTERKRAQQAIRESEEKYRSITENIDDFLYTFERVDSTLRPVFYTASVEKITGYTQAEFIEDSKLLLQIIHPDDFTAVKKKLKNLMRSQIQLSDEIEFRLLSKHGNIVWVRNKVNLIRNNKGKIQKIYGLVSDITLRKRAEEELNRSTDNLLKLNETKDRFISIISHDLRTPFSSILGFTDLLLSDEELSDKEKKQYVKFIQDSSNSMLALVNSLLDWTRLQTGRIKFEPEKTYAVELINNSINALSGAAFQKKIDLKSTVDEDLVVFIDKNLITQVFNNLISNAIKFTKKGGKITISSYPAALRRFVEFSVKDTGMGIKKENLKELFRIDTKFSTEGTAGEKGSGLGLTLVKEIVEKHGGSVWVESEYGKGSDFKFTIPVAPANILLVDDSKTDRILYSKILKNIVPDYSIEIASDGKEALEKVTQTPPALIITDHIMPEMNGYDLVMQIQKADIKSKPAIIVLSSDIDRNAIEDYNNIGIEYVFHKPVNLSNFKQAVEKSLKKGFTKH